MAEWHVPVNVILESWTMEQLELMFRNRNRRMERMKQASENPAPKEEMRTWVPPAEPPPPPAYWKKKD